MKVTQELLKDIGFEESYRLEKCYVYKIDCINFINFYKEIIIYENQINDMEVSYLFKLIKDYHKDYYFKQGENKAKHDIADTLKRIIQI